MVFPWDEIDQLTGVVRTRKMGENRPSKAEVDELVDEVLEMLILAYSMGYSNVSSQEPSFEEMREVIERPVAGKTFRERVTAYANGEMGDTTGTPQEAIAKVIETDATRIFNEAGEQAAKKKGLTSKTWHTMEDEKVRDAHVILDRQTVSIDADFYTDGGKAPGPGRFGVPELDCNCRCYLTFS